MDEIPDNINNINTIIKLVKSHPSSINKKYGQYHETILHVACRCGWINIAKYLMANGADINTHDRFGDTPLHNAACCGYFEVVKCLLDSGADNLAINNRGHTAARASGRRGNYDCAAYIEDYEYELTKGVHLEET
jgi:ankyrin repeat protein